MKFNFKSLYRLGKQNDNDLKLASVSEQILFSGCNFICAIAILKVSSVKDYGVYSFLFTLVTLFNGIFASLIHRQMQLDIASKDEAGQNRGYRASFFLELILMSGLMLMAALILYGANLIGVNIDLLLILSVVGYLIVFNIFELGRRFLYCKNMQVHSLKITVKVFGSLLLWLFAYIVIDNEKYAIHLVFLSLTLAFLIGLVLNTLCVEILSNKHIKVKIKNTAMGYYAQGKYGVVGMFATWLQNQSINPFLMYVAGPLVVGYFALGRLIVMPIIVIANGLASSALPKLRRFAKNELKSDVFKEINTHSLIVIAFALVYGFVLLSLHLTGVLDKIVPEYQEVKYYLFFWMIAFPTINYRFWRSQYFVAHVQLDLVLRIALLSAAVVALSMVIIAYLFKAPVFSILGLIFAEIIAIVILTVLIKKSLKLV